MKLLGYLRIMLIAAFPVVQLPVNAVPDPQQAKQAEQEQIKRLILKDGSHESISHYSIEGDRVRYFSTERFAWEELPILADRLGRYGKYADRAAQDANESRSHALEIAAEEKREEEARLPWVAPGIRVPAAGRRFSLNAISGQARME